ncbi:MAG TPA: hypothetical protein VNX86_04815 [Rhizomicrobium sp.]|jgi:hypothetical protein|nr:hypothetical protein [Rhizomicrobium sp.]
MRLILALALACALAACASGGGQPPPPPPTKILLGAHVPWSQNAMTPVVALEASLARKLDIVKFYPGGWSWSAWDIAFAKAIIAHGATPYMVIGNRVGQDQCGMKFADVIAGTDDPKFIADAQQLAALNAPVAVEVLPEMTQSAMDCAYPNGTPDPTIYKAAYRHIALIIMQYAPKANLVWSPGRPAYAAGVAKNYYPGADVVGLVGEHLYNSTTTPEAFDPAVCQLAASLGKPPVIGETNAIGTSAQVEWWSTVKATCNYYAVIGFDAPGSPGYDYTITAPDVFAAFAAVGAQ